MIPPRKRTVGPNVPIEPPNSCHGLEVGELLFEAFLNIKGKAGMTTARATLARIKFHSLEPCFPPRSTPALFATNETQLRVKSSFAEYVYLVCI